MRLLLAFSLATLTAASLAAIRPALLTGDERHAAGKIRESRMRADVRFLASDLLEGRGPGTRGDRLVRAYLVARFEALALEPGAGGGSWEQGANVVARLAGRDPELAKEVVLFAANHDGALDDAAGLATMLAVAEAFAALPERPRRSILFAAVAGEEQGLPIPQHVVARINLGGGRARGAGTPRAGLGPSALDDWVRAIAQAQGRHLVTETVADAGAYAFSSTVEDAQLVFLLGVKVANAPQPSWRAGDELAAARSSSLAEIGR